MSASPTNIKGRDNNDDVSVIADQAGVAKVEATYQVFGSVSKWALFVSLGLAAYIYSLDGTTTYSYLALAASDLKAHSMISSIQVAQSIITAVGKPVVAKVADVGSRGWAYVFVLVFYVVGYVIIASAKNIGSLAGGMVIYSVGNTGLQLLTQIIIADITTLKWRGLVSSLISLPFVINAFVGSNIFNSVLKNSGWRWGYGMFAILVPAALGPLIVTLLWAERKAKRLGLLDVLYAHASPSESLKDRIVRVTKQLDVIGLCLIGASISLILIPITLARKTTGDIAEKWKEPGSIVMLVLGFVLIPLFVFYEWKYAKHPVVPKRFVTNRSFVIATTIGFFDFISFYLTFTYLYSFVIVVKPWPLLHASYFSQTQTVALTVFAILAGILMRFVRHAKIILIVGLAIRLFGVGLMIHSRGANSSDAELVWTQLLQGIGGGFAAICSQVSAQASVPHTDVATVTAVALLITEVGGAIGAALAGAIWTNVMPGKLDKYLAPVGVPEEQRKQLFGSILAVIQFPRGHPIREGVIVAYGEVMFIMVVLATVVAAIPLALSFLMPNWYLGDSQNAVDGRDLAGVSAISGVGSRSSTEVAEKGAKSAGKP